MYMLAPGCSSYNSLSAESIAHTRHASKLRVSRSRVRASAQIGKGVLKQRRSFALSPWSLHVAVPKPTPLPLQDPTHHVPPSSLIPHTHLDLHVSPQPHHLYNHHHPHQVLLRLSTHHGRHQDCSCRGQRPLPPEGRHRHHAVHRLAQGGRQEGRQGQAVRHN